MNSKFKPHVSEINTEKNAYRLFVKSLFFLATADGLELYQLSRISWKLGSGSWNAHALAYNTRAGLFRTRARFFQPPSQLCPGSGGGQKLRRLARHDLGQQQHPEGGTLHQNYNYWEHPLCYSVELISGTRHSNRSAASYCCRLAK